MEELFDRRRFLTAGGLTIVTAAVVGACGDSGDGGGAEGAAEEEDPDTKATPSDITLLRTAASLEVLASQVYDRAIKSGVIRNQTITSAARLFKKHHTEHAELINATTKRFGGEGFDQPNPVLAQQLDARIRGIANENDLVLLAIDLERAAAATYQASTGKFSMPSLNQTAMSVGGAEARHIAYLSGLANRPTADRPFATTEAAVAPGTGV